MYRPHPHADLIPATAEPFGIAPEAPERLMPVRVYPDRPMRPAGGALGLGAVSTPRRHSAPRSVHLPDATSRCFCQSASYAFRPPSRRTTANASGSP